MQLISASQTAQAFAKLRNTAHIVLGEGDNFPLRFSPDLSKIPFVSYGIRPRWSNWTGVVLVPVLDTPNGEGTLGIEIVSPENKIVCQTRSALSQIQSYSPVYLAFPPITSSHQGIFALRVFARDASPGLYILENRLGSSPQGLRRWRTHPRCGLIFSTPEPPQTAVQSWRSNLSPELASFVGSTSFEDHYWSSGWQTASVQLMTDLHLTDSIIEIGCGVGRLAYGLHGWYPGRYLGVDIVPDLIAYCKKQFPLFEFHQIDVQSKYYNPNGKLAVSKMTIPAEDATFDVAVLFSVYTHLLPDGFDRMTSEVSRILKPGGRCLATFLIYDNMSDKAIFSFKYELQPYCRVEKQAAPEHAVGYRHNFVIETFARYGMQIETFYQGSWTGYGRLGTQDQVLFRKLPIIN